MFVSCEQVPMKIACQCSPIGVNRVFDEAGSCSPVVNVRRDEQINALVFR